MRRLFSLLRAHRVTWTAFVLCQVLFFVVQVVPAWSRIPFVLQWIDVVVVPVHPNLGTSQPTWNLIRLRTWLPTFTQGRPLLSPKGPLRSARLNLLGKRGVQAGISLMVPGLHIAVLAARLSAYAICGSSGLNLAAVVEFVGAWARFESLLLLGGIVTEGASHGFSGPVTPQESS